VTSECVGLRARHEQAAVTSDAHSRSINAGAEIIDCTMVDVEDKESRSIMSSTRVVRCRSRR
jgi:hypothetical protein